jgi:hypothetical protein
MITELFVEDVRLDLFDDIGFDLNYQIDDIKDFSARNTSYSKTITIPGNANNNKLFGHIYNISAANNYFNSNPDLPNIGYNFDPSRQASAKIFINKIQVFKGVLRLLEVQVKNGMITYECAVFGELGGFVNDIGKLLNNKTKLEDLDVFNQYNKEWNYANIVASWNASNVAQGKGVVFPLIDYGQCKSGSGGDYHLNAFRPAFFVYEIIDAIITKAGYTYDSQFLNGDFFKTLIIPNNRANLEQIRKDLLAVGSGSSISSSASLPMSNVITLNLFTNSGNTDFAFTGSNGTIGRVKLKGTYNLTTPATTTITLYKNASVIATETTTSDYNNRLVTLDWDYATTLNTGDNLSIGVTISAVDPYNFSFDHDLELDFVSDYAQASVATSGVMLNMQNLLPKGIEQKDFFLSICRMFNLYVFEDRNKTKHLKIEPFVDFYDSTGFINIDTTQDLVLHGETGDPTGLVYLYNQWSKALDWSKKVNSDTDMKIKPMSELNSRFYKFMYEQDEDFYNDSYFKRYNQTYGDRLFDTKFQFSNDTTEVKVIFAPTVLASRSGDTKLASQIFKVDSNNVEVPFDSKIRILQYKYIADTPSFAIKEVYPNTSTTLGTPTTYGYCGHLDSPTSPTKDLNFGVPNELRFTLNTSYPTANLFTTNWGSYLAEIISKDSKLVTCYLYLTIADIYALDFSKLIFINNAFFKINKIIDFNLLRSQTTQVELLKVIELTYN